MPSPTLVGAVLGLGVQVYANAVRKVPLLEGPWRHGAAMLAGAAFGSWLVDFEERTEKDLKVMLDKRAETERVHQRAVADKS